MRVAVTGATGFVGRYVLQSLAKHNVDVIAATHKNAVIDTSDRLRCVKVDVHNPPSAIFEYLHRPDVLIHLAWGNLPNYASPHHSEVELPAQFNFLRTIVKDGLQTLLVTGTCLEYGMQSGCLSEHMQARPCTAYGSAKDTLRRRLERLAVSNDTALIWSRLFYVYGTGQATTSLHTQLETAVKRGDATFDMSGGEQIRDFSPIEEVAGTLVELALRQKKIGTVNVCSGRPISVRNLVEEWIAKNRWQIGLNLGKYPYPTYEPMAFWGDRSKLQSILDERA